MSVLHEKWNIARFISGEKISFTPFYTGTSNSSQLTPFSFRVDEVVYFGDGIIPNMENRQRLYIPVNQSHPCWDCIYDDGVKTAFFSFSISDFWEGHDKSMMKSLSGGMLNLLNATL
jgi:hypothetical protein